MRIIGQLKDETSAHKLSEHLWAKSIHNEVESEDDGSWSIWVSEEDQLEPARAEFERFRSDPGGGDYASITRRAKAVREELAEKERQAKKIKKRRDLFVDVQAYRVGPLTYALMAVCILVTLLTEFGAATGRANGLFITEIERLDEMIRWRGGLPEIWRGQVWRLITPIFLHMSPIHLLFNMWIMFLFAAMVEARKGGTYLMLLICVSATFSNLLQYYFSSPAFGGFSGVNYALLGYLWMKGRYSRAEGMGVSQQTAVILMIWFVLCVLQILPNVANWCHAGGLVVGLIWGLVTSRGAWREILGSR